MRVIPASKIRDAVSQLCIQANLVLRKDVVGALKSAYLKETNKRAKDILRAIIKNALMAKREKLAICQDTGLLCVFVEIGQDVRISGDLKEVINRGIELGYRRGFLRNSVVEDPLLRSKPKYRPAIIHIDIVKGNKIKLTVLPKGFGCENKTQLKMFTPTAKINEIKKFIIEVVKSAGPDACPPFIVGVGIGGTADYACFLAKKALLLNTQYLPALPRRQAGGRQGSILNTQLAKLKRDLLKEISKLNIGPMGLGGRTTALAVNIKTYPTHIAGLPVAINISCHALRSATEEI